MFWFKAILDPVTIHNENIFVENNIKSLLVLKFRQIETS